MGMFRKIEVRQRIGPAELNCCYQLLLPGVGVEKLDLRKMVRKTSR
jgi:hypothetical protein